MFLIVNITPLGVRKVGLCGALKNRDFKKPRFDNERERMLNEPKGIIVLLHAGILTIPIEHGMFL